MPDAARLPDGPAFSAAAGASAGLSSGALIPRPSRICRFLPLLVGAFSESVQIRRKL